MRGPSSKRNATYLNRNLFLEHIRIICACVFRPRRMQPRQPRLGPRIAACLLNVRGGGTMYGRIVSQCCRFRLWTCGCLLVSGTILASIRPQENRGATSTKLAQENPNPPPPPNPVRWGRGRLVECKDFPKVGPQTAFNGPPFRQ